MDVFQIGLERADTIWTAVPMMLLAAILLMAWFPGHNARRWGHANAEAVGRIGWWLGGAAVIASLTGFFDIFSPVMLMAWLGLIAWSYGKRPFALQASSRKEAFGVILPVITMEAEEPRPNAGIATS